MSNAFKNKVKLNGWVDVVAFGAKGDGVTNDSTAFTDALATGKKVFVPAGTYLINITITDKFVMEGGGSNKTFIKPYNTSVAAITYTASGPYWTYHSEVRNICFKSTSKVGVGFTFGTTLTSSYSAGMEYANNVRFTGCHFNGLEKGIQFPFGNIGSEFYSCAFNENKYGVYTLNNKFGGDAMHAGNKYFYGGHFGSNECGFYCHNTEDGFGGVSFDNTIFETNAIATYIYTNNTAFPVEFKGCWNELNGTSAGLGSTITLDQWSGSTKSTTAFPACAHAFDGSDSLYHYKGGRVTDFYIKGTNTNVVSEGSFTEYQSGFGGKTSVVDAADSQLTLRDPITDAGVPKGARTLVEGIVRWRATPTVNNDVVRAPGRWYVTGTRHTKQSRHGGTGTVLNLTSSTGLGNGAFATINGSVVSDGKVFPTVNEWTVPFTSSTQYMQLLGSSTALTAGWWVATVDVKVTSGSPLFYLWDRSSAQMSTLMNIPVNNQWHTIAAMAYSPGSQTIYFDVGGTASSCTFRASAFQLRRFDTQSEAEQFLRARVYVEPSFSGSATYDPPSLADGAGTTTTVSVTGAAVGDVAIASFSQDLQGIILSAWVSSANTVSVRFQNESGGTLDLASGTLFTQVIRP